MPLKVARERPIHFFLPGSEAWSPHPSRVRRKCQTLEHRSCRQALASLAGSQRPGPTAGIWSPAFDARLQFAAHRSWCRSAWFPRRSAVSAAGFSIGIGFDFRLEFAALPRPRAWSTEARRSTSMRNGCPEEYSAWNITFHDWQITRRRMIGSCAENWARRQSMVSTPLSSSSVKPVENGVEIAQHEPKK